MSDLRKVTEGALLLSENRRGEANAMIAGEIPSAWDGFFSGPERIIPWLTALVNKAVAIQEWQSLSLSNALLKSKINISNLFRPQTFLNALRQESAHATREPLVALKLVSSFGNPPAGVAMPVCLTGLLLQGALVDDRGVLQEVQSADAAAFAPLPDVFIGWRLGVENQAAAVAIPVYTNPAKDCLVMELMFAAPSISDVDNFILSGVAVMLEQ
jgi:dynein heavy chain 2